MRWKRQRPIQALRPAPATIGGPDSLPALGQSAPLAPYLIVINPSGNRTRMPIDPLPFSIGRSSDNNLVLRDNRASRNHARIVAGAGDYFIEDLNSSHGVEVNGVRIDKRRKLEQSDRIEFGVPDSYGLVFSLEADGLQQILDEVTSTKSLNTDGNLQKLRALVEVARTVQNSLSPQDVLSSVVDAALAVTGFQRGFLMLSGPGGLEVRVARDSNGSVLQPRSLEVPMSAIQEALQHRSDLLAMSFDPESAGFRPSASDTVSDPHRVICVPLVHVRTGSSEETRMISAKNDTI